jgi:REP element-mobilizing transposase RayT
MKQLEFAKTKGWGGKRRGAGRKNLSKTVNHHKRERVDWKKPLHITHRLKENGPNLRTRGFHRQFRQAIGRIRGFGVHVLHYSILNNHLHMIVEARDNKALTKGMRSLFTSLAKKLNWGRIFDGRYHLRVITSPTQMKNTLKYVLLNAAQHAKLIDYIDEFSSGHHFPHWRKACQNYRATSDANRASRRLGASRPIAAQIMASVTRLDEGAVTSLSLNDFAAEVEIEALLIVAV